MKSYLKTATISFPGNEPERLDIVELSAHSQMEVAELEKERTAVSLAAVCRFGVLVWQCESVEDIAKNVPLQVLSAIVREIYALSGITAQMDTAEGKKNSGNGLTDDSSFDSLPT